MDQRRDSLAHWAATQIHRIFDEKVDAKLDMVSGDASFRRYFRLHLGERSWVCVDAPPDKEDNPRFVRIARQWRDHSVAVPEVLAEDFAQGFMLLEDFGDSLLWPALHDDKADQAKIAGLYRQAITELLKIQLLPVSDLEKYDDALLQQEMALFPDWLCEKQLGLVLSAEDLAMLAHVRQRLTESALSQPIVSVHRDYHSRNLMLCGDDNHIGVIDFQDAVAGPATYDLVSLLRDCYVSWPDSLVDTLAEEYWRQASAQGIWQSDLSDFRRAFDLMGMQRHMKAAGIFARLNIRDGKDGYLASIPNTCDVLRRVAGHYPEFSDFCTWLDHIFLPAMRRALL